MSYTRGVDYVWDDGKHVHIWSATGKDDWEDSGWHDNRGGPSAAGIKLPTRIFDELVVMRYAEMTTRQIEAAKKRALKKHKGNGGCEALAAGEER